MHYHLTGLVNTRLKYLLYCYGRVVQLGTVMLVSEHLTNMRVCTVQPSLKRGD